MYCSKCGREMKEGVNFCKWCGEAADRTEGEVSEGTRRLVRFFYTYKTRILLIVLAVLVLCAAGVGAWFYFLNGSDGQKSEKKVAAAVKSPRAVDLKDAYEIEDNRLVLDPLYVTYADGTVEELTVYDVYIDTIKYELQDGAIDAAELYDGRHLFRLEWQKNASRYEYEKTIGTEHKKDTWGKYVELPGMSGKEIAAAYGALGAPEFGELTSGDWGYAYVSVDSLSLEAVFPAGILDRPEDYSDSEAVCIEMSGTLNTLFYNMEQEMSKGDLESLLGISLSESEAGGCVGTLENGKQIYIGSGQVQDGIYTPDTSVRVSVSEEDRGTLLERLF